MPHDEPRQASLMSLNRFEAFSDGVFAIAVTLLVLETKVPDLSQTTSSEAITKLLHVFPHILSYITSFIVIGVLWINHHALCQPQFEYCALRVSSFVLFIAWNY